MTDTPETDNLARGNHVVPTEFAEKLERERDEAIRRYAELVHLYQPERKHIGRWGSGSNKELFASPYIIQ